MEYKYVIYWQEATKEEKKVGFTDRFIEIPFDVAFSGQRFKKHVKTNSETWNLLEPIKIKTYTV